MKTGQIALVGLMACLLGCGGLGAYVPDQVEEETPVQCADLSLSLPSSFSVTQGDTNTESFSIINGQVSALQSRAPGEAVVAFSVSGLPNFVTGTVTPNPVTVQLDDLENVDLELDATGAQGGTAYNVTITATQSGCESVSETASLNVLNQGS